MEVGATISIKGLKGIVRYVGEYHEKPGIYVGVELEKPKGKNNGTIKGKKYFECPENHGLFVDINTAKSIMKVVSENGETSDSTPLNSPRLDLKQSTKTHPISKSIDSLKGTTTPTSIMKSSPNLQQTPGKVQAPNSSRLADSKNELHSAREPTVKFVKPRSHTTNINPAKSSSEPESATASPQNKEASTTKSKPQTSSTVNPDPLARRTSMSPSSSLNKSNAKPNDSNGSQSARSPSQPTQNFPKIQASPSRDSILTSDTKTESSHKTSAKPSNQSKSTPEKTATTPQTKAPSTQPTATTTKSAPQTSSPVNPDPLARGASMYPSNSLNKSNSKPNDLNGPQSARRPSPPTQNFPKIQTSPSRDSILTSDTKTESSENVSAKLSNHPSDKQITSTNQNSPIVPQQQKNQNDNIPKVSHPSIPPLSIPQIPIGESNQSKESATSVSFEEIKSKIPATAASAMPSANRQYQQRLIQQSTDLPITTNSAEQSDIENSPRQARPQQAVITPEIQAKINELKAKHEGYIKQKALIRQKLLDIATSYKKKKAEQEKYITKFIQESQNKLIELEISLESDINDLETQILESAERTHRYLEIADEQRANKVMELLRQINEEHVNFENDLDLFINAQRINVNKATQSVHILTDRLKKILMKKQFNDKLINKKKSIIADRESELAEKRPRWQEVTQLRTTFSELSEKVSYLKKTAFYKNAEREGMQRFYQMFAEVPLLDSLYQVLCIEKKTENNDIRHICELTKFVLSGFIANTAKCYDLFNALVEINESLQKNEIPHSLISVTLALDAISSVPLDNALTVFQLKASANKIKDEKLKNQTIEIISEIKNSPLIHYALLDPSKKEDFIEFAKNLVFELKKAEADEEDEECNIDQFKGQLEKFNVPEIDVIKGFIDFQMPQQTSQDKQKVLPEITKKKQEKKDIEAKSQFLQEEIEKEKAKFEVLRNELSEPMKLYMELADRLEATKKKLDKYQIQNE